MTFDEMKAIEPRLQHLAETLIERRRLFPEWNERILVWVHDFKPLMCRLVGWGAEYPALRSSECYDCAYTHLAAAFEI